MDVTTRCRPIRAAAALGVAALLAGTLLVSPPSTQPATASVQTRSNAEARAGRATSGLLTRASHQKVHLTTFPGFGLRVRRGHIPRHQLRHTSASFRKFLTHRLNTIWSWTNRRPACRDSALVIVRRYRSDGFAQVTDEGSFPTSSEPVNCATGGNAAIWKKARGKWKEVLFTQEAGYPCAALRHRHVPASIGGYTCYQSDGVQNRWYPRRVHIAWSGLWHVHSGDRLSKAVRDMGGWVDYSCFHYIEGLPPGYSIDDSTLQDQRVDEISTTRPQAVGPGGIRVGMSLKKVRSRFAGRLHRHLNSESGTYDYWVAGGGHHVLWFRLGYDHGTSYYPHKVGLFALDVNKTSALRAMGSQGC